MQCDSPFYVLPKKWASEKVPVPCGKCPPCKLRRVNSWVFRLLQEEKVSTAAHFVTLTYDIRCVPISENGFMTLSKRDFQLFMKRLRKLATPTLSTNPLVRPIKYYAVGEYGTQNNRPHYHAIIFNVSDEELYNMAWGLGQIHIGKVSGDSIAYTMKYIDKQRGKRLHVRDDRQPEFPLMSKCLGANYLTAEMIAYHKADLSRLYVTKEGGHKIALPRYYRQKIYTDADLKLQVELIQAKAAERELLDRREFDLLGYPSGFTFEQWKESGKYGRYQAFYKNQKSRNI